MAQVVSCRYSVLNYCQHRPPFPTAASRIGDSANMLPSYDASNSRLLGITLFSIYLCLCPCMNGRWPRYDDNLGEVAAQWKVPGSCRKYIVVVSLDTIVGSVPYRHASEEEEPVTMPLRFDAAAVLHDGVLFTIYSYCTTPFYKWLCLNLYLLAL